MNQPLCGILVIDKPLGFSSMRAVSQVRRAALGAKTGHAGTLDPLATGVLVMALGKATRIIDRLMATDKRYGTTIDFSAFTTTDDREGERTEIFTAAPPTRADVIAAIAPFIGTIQQRPPAYSAMKVGGRRAYKLARQGEAPVLAHRPVVIHDLVLERYEWPLADLFIHCGKGTYIRSLARDLGVALGVGGHCAALRRTAVGPFTDSMAHRIEDLPHPLSQADLLSVDHALAMVAA
jgi:tRNA pseudouridine55 synthase